MANFENIEKLLKLLERLPDERFNLAYWHQFEGELLPFNLPSVNKCRTEACLAGWASTLDGLPSNCNVHLETRAKTFLNLDDLEANHMFMGKWRFKYPCLSLVRKEHAIRYLKKVLAYGDVMVSLEPEQSY